VTRSYIYCYGETPEFLLAAVLTSSTLNVWPWPIKTAIQ